MKRGRWLVPSSSKLPRFGCTHSNQFKPSQYAQGWSKKEERIQVQIETHFKMSTCTGLQRIGQTLHYSASQCSNKLNEPDCPTGLKMNKSDKWRNIQSLARDCYMDQTVWPYGSDKHHTDSQLEVAQWICTDRTVQLKCTTSWTNTRTNDVSHNG